jgi:hypothetical protein
MNNPKPPKKFLIVFSRGLGTAPRGWDELRAGTRPDAMVNFHRNSYAAAVLNTREVASLVTCSCRWDIRVAFVIILLKSPLIVACNEPHLE